MALHLTEIRIQHDPDYLTVQRMIPNQIQRSLSITLTHMHHRASRRKGIQQIKATIYFVMFHVESQTDFQLKCVVSQRENTIFCCNLGNNLQSMYNVGLYVCMLIIFVTQWTHFVTFASFCGHPVLYKYVCINTNSIGVGIESELVYPLL